MTFEPLIAFFALFAASQPLVVTLAPDQCHFFGEFNSSWTEYLGLDYTGRYVSVNSQHLFVEVQDQGAWRQLPTGVVELISDRRLRAVEAPPLEVFLWHVSPGEQTVYLGSISSALERLLAERKRDSFSLREVRSIYRRPSVLPGETIPAVDLLEKYPDRDPRMSRRDLEALKVAIGKYLAAPDQNVFRFTPLAFGSDTFLEWQNTGTLWQRDRFQQISMLKDMRFGQYPAMVFTPIPIAAFAEGAGTTQAFQFYPEMNERRGHDQLPLVAQVTALCAARGESP